MVLLLSSFAWAISATVAPGDDLHAVLAALGPGDVITFTDGIYPLESTLRVQEALGEADAPVRLIAAEGATPILKATGTSTVLEIRDSSHVHLEGLTLEGPDGWEEEGGAGLVVNRSTDLRIVGNTVRQVRGDLLRIAGDTANLEIRGNALHHASSGSGIYAGCGDGSCWMTGSVIAGNLLHDIGSPDVRRDGIVLENGCQGNTVRDNVLFRVSGTGLRTESTQLGEANTVEGNAIWDTGAHGIDITGEAVVRNNIVFHTGRVGIRSGQHENGDLRNVRISFNTVALAGDEGVRLNDWADKEGMVFSSNVIANITGRGFRYDADDWEETGTGNYITANVVSGLVEGVDPALYPDWYRPGSGLADFADVENWDFYPATDSSLIGTGDPSPEAWVPEVDFNGLPRNGEAPTVGAYQWSGAGNPGWLLAETFKDSDPPLIVDAGSGGCCRRNDDGTLPAGLFLPVLGWAVRRRKRG